jgi:hypothetical protein
MLSLPGALGSVDRALRDLQHRFGALLGAIASKEISCTVYRASDQTIAHNTITPISWSHESHDDGGCWDIGAPTRLVAPSAGVYLIAASWVTKDHSTDMARSSIFFRKNGAAYLGGTSDNFPGTVAVSGAVMGRSHAYVAKMQAGDYFEVIAFHNEGGDRLLWGGALYNFGSIARIY